MNNRYSPVIFSAGRFQIRQGSKFIDFQALVSGFMHANEPGTFIVSVGDIFDATKHFAIEVEFNKLFEAIENIVIEEIYENEPMGFDKSFNAGVCVCVCNIKENVKNDRHDKSCPMFLAFPEKRSIEEIKETLKNRRYDAFGKGKARASADTQTEDRREKPVLRGTWTPKATSRLRKKEK